MIPEEKPAADVVVLKKRRKAEEFNGNELDYKPKFEQGRMEIRLGKKMRDLGDLRPKVVIIGAGLAVRLVLKALKVSSCVSENMLNFL